MSKYWTYTIKYVPRTKPLKPQVHDAFLHRAAHNGDEYCSYCMQEGDGGFGSPEEAIAHANNLFRYLPREELVEKRQISEAEFRAWLCDRALQAKEAAVECFGPTVFKAGKN